MLDSTPNPSRGLRLGRIVGALAVAGCLALPAVAGGSTNGDPAVKALQIQVKQLKKQMAALSTQVSALQGSVKDAAGKADSASSKADAASALATTASAKTNCIVNATAFRVWSNGLYALDSQTVGVGTVMDIASPSDGSPSGYLAGINPQCVPSVLPRSPSSSALSFNSAVKAARR